MPLTREDLSISSPQQLIHHLLKEMQRGRKQLPSPHTLAALSPTTEELLKTQQLQQPCIELFGPSAMLRPQVAALSGRNNTTSRPGQRSGTSISDTVQRGQDWWRRACCSASMLACSSLINHCVFKGYYGVVYAHGQQSYVRAGVHLHGAAESWDCSQVSELDKKSWWSSSLNDAKWRKLY